MMTKNDEYDDLRARLSPQQRRAAERLAMGYSITAAAEVVGVTRQTVSGWKNQDRDFQRYLLLLTDEITADSVARLKQISNRAMDVIEAALSDDSSAALETAMFVLRHVTPATRKPEPRAVTMDSGPEMDAYVRAILDGVQDAQKLT